MDYFRSFLKGVDDDPIRTKDKALCLYEIARHYERNKQKDSAIFYARRAYDLNRQHSFKTNILNTSILLSNLYQSSNLTDSAYKYLKIKDETQEYMFSKEKLSRMQTLEFNEQLHQREAETARQDAAQERSRNIQLIILAISIITALILFLLLSRSIIVSHKLVAFLSIVALLVVFEFVNLLVHPWLEKITHHTPALMLVSLVCIASLLVPMHHRLERWATTRLVEKNKKIRLKAAKKTIEQLERTTAK